PRGVNEWNVIAVNPYRANFDG
ncbi:hypothetical protein A2U01_0097737, partial [Trifolium medium]|nr:hypothetical protein [Trifolium medium]